jgi:hypothetical protein
MIKVTFEFETATDALEAISRVALTATVQPNATASGCMAAAKRGRKPKKDAAVTEARAEPDANSPAAQGGQGVMNAMAESAAPVTAAPLTLDDVRAALREVFKASDARVVTDLLKEYKVVRVGDVPPERFSQFVKSCKDLL